MEWLNYHHLLYFWTVVREGGVSAAAKRLRLAQPTVSGQLKTLEDALGEPLFTRSGRKLVLTETGQVVYRYAEEIFSLGRELQDVLKGRPSRRPQRLVVGLSEALPKLVAYRVLEPALRLPEPVQMVCLEDEPERLLSELSLHALDVVISDAPASPVPGTRVYSHLLGECGVSLFATGDRAAELRHDFPRSLAGAPMLLPDASSALRRSLEHWLAEQRLQPLVAGEFQDSALLKVFGQAGAGVFAAPSAIEAEVEAQYGVQVVGRIESIRERFYALTAERRLKHPAVVAITHAARTELFAPRRRG
ncbi:MAG TPA: transcriptional activator NhaR [Aggregicoccus sp.]|nr:transcriptional activator NhaR [Aggregicoccus sp.]